jgi:ribosomal protein L31
MIKKLFLLLLSGMFLLNACLPGPGVVTVTPAPASAQAETPTPLGADLPTNPPDPALTPIPALGEVEEPTPTETSILIEPAPLPSYLLDTVINYDIKTVSVNQSIHYANSTGVSLNELVLAVVPNLWVGVFRLESLKIFDLLEPEYNLDGQQLAIQLPDPLPPNAEISLQIGYTLNLPAHNPNPDPNLVRPDIFGYTANQLNLVDWYPFIVPYEDGWMLNRPWFYGEHLVYDLSDFEVNLTFSDPSRAPVVAASGHILQSEEGSTTYRLNAGRTFALSMSREYQVATANVDGVEVSSYHFPFFKTGGQAALDATLKSVETFNKLFGPYRHETLAVVQGDFNDGMEYDGLYFLSNAFYNLYDGTERNFLVMVAAHETSHMWWFGAVGNDQANEPWLDESLATYSERLFYEDQYPEAVPWWWSYRITFYAPQGKINDNVPNYGGFTPYTNATYRRGALFLEDLRKRIGDEAFFAFLQDYYAQMSGQRATRADFFRVLSTHHTVDISDLLVEYFANP